MRNIYILISTTPTKFGALIRKFGGVRYNHAAISLNSDLTKLYAFARSKHRNLLSGRLVKENLARYTLGFKYNVDCVVFEIPVTNQQYAAIENLIKQIYMDESYLYNLFSVLSYPIFHGFTTHNAFSCIEFVMFILKNFTSVGLPNKSPCCFKPDELLSILGDCIYYRGSLKEYMGEEAPSEAAEEYFQPLTMKDVGCGALTLVRLSYRLLFVRLGTHSSY
jgi:hypothetical protein